MQKHLNWTPDEDTLYWATQFPLQIQSPVPTEQYAGNNMHVNIWMGRISRAGFPSFSYKPDADGVVFCSPQNIIRCMKDGSLLEALAMVISWGGMARTQKYIYTKRLQEIKECLQKAFESIEATQSVEHAWELLIQGLGWSPVMSSKTLHFICRSLAYEENPPVAIDHAIVLGKVWPQFYKNATISGADSVKLPGKWDDGGSWSAYNRYMTAINCWAAQKGWTTTQFENTLFEEYK